MKTKLFLFTASLLLLACSNDDDGGTEAPQELKIKTFTTIGVDANGTPTGDNTEYSFNENGTLSQKKTDEAASDYTRVINYTYNQLGQLTESNMTFIGVNTNRRLGYNYDSVNKLDYITESYDGAIPEIYFDLTHEPNKISVEHRSPGFYDYLNYSNNILTSIDRLVDLGGYSTENLTYGVAHNLKERAINGSDGFNNDFTTNHTYEYDDKINPLYPSFNENPLNLLGQYWFNLDYWKPFLSANNFTNEVYTNTQLPQDNYTLLRTFQYNEAGYPISAVVKKDGVLIEEFAYEYY